MNNGLMGRQGFGAPLISGKEVAQVYPQDGQVLVYHEVDKRWRPENPSGATPDIATQPEAEAGTDNTKMMTPLRVAEAIVAQGAAGGGGGSYTVATAPDPSTRIGQTILVTDGANGLPCGALSNGSQWLQLHLGAGITATNPIGSLPGLVTWLDASALSLSDGDNVTSWTDESGHGNHAVDGGSPPVFHTNIVNGYPAVLFTRASTQSLSIPSNDTDFVFPGDFSVALVMKPVTWGGSSEGVLSHKFSDYDAGWVFYTNNYSASKFTVRVDREGTSEFGVDAATLSDVSTDNFALYVFQRSGSNLIWRINGSTDSITSAYGDAITGTGSDLYLGYSQTWGGFYNGYICEVVIINGALSTDDREALEATLMSKYGL
jgi:hypothetical protein